MDWIKGIVCAHWKLDPFKETDRPLDQWVYMYLIYLTNKLDTVIAFDKPLAELSGEIAGGFWNPEGLKKYYEQKQAIQASESGKTRFEESKDGGTAVANTVFQNGKIVDKDTGQEIMDVGRLDELLDRLNSK